MLSAEDRQLLVDQALALIEHLYVHLPLKRAMHAVDPIQRLRLLKRRSTSLSEPAFHAEMISIFTRLRDLHTTYILPQPLQSLIAFLPFRMDEFFDGDEQRYLVTEVKPALRDATFNQGVLVTHWNGVPIHRAVEINADREAGSNLDARHARGLASMTIRPLAFSLPPDEEWVVVTFRAGGRVRERRLKWEVFEHVPDGGQDPLTATGDLGFVLGLDAKAELERQARKLLFAPEAVDIARRVQQQTEPDLGAGPDLAAPVDFSVVSKLPDVFSFRTVKTPSGTFGYARIHTFYVPDDTVFVEEFIRILDLIPQNGLILDVRGNGGGNILAGERLLQLLTPQSIDPERFYFINSALTLQLCEANDSLAPWRESISQAVETGAAFSHGFSLRPVDRYNDIGQIYQGPVVLVTDARCYSTTDIFSAGFQDHGIGKILGTSGKTGAGGANVWDHGLLLSMLSSEDGPFRPLPQNASFRVAVRRCTRVGKRSGELVEDLGVVADAIHRITRRDLLNGAVDLINRAGEMLAAMDVQAVTAQIRKAAAEVSVAVATNNVSRLDLFINGRPQRTFDVTDGTTSIELPGLAGGPNTIEIRGFRADQLVASTRVRL